MHRRGDMSDEPEITESERRAQTFERMAAQIRLNKDAKFGGAFLFIPPDGEPQASLMLNQEQPGIFWSAIQTLAQMAIDAISQEQRQQGFGRR